MSRAALEPCAAVLASAPVLACAAVLACVALLAGCGQKGPLYLPDRGTPVVTRPGPASSVPASSAQSRSSSSSRAVESAAPHR